MAEITDICEVTIEVNDGIARFWLGGIMFTLETTGDGTSLIVSQNGESAQLLSIGQGQGITISIESGKLVIAATAPSSISANGTELTVGAIEDGEIVRRAGTTLGGYAVGRQSAALLPAVNLSTVEGDPGEYELPLSDNRVYTASGLSGSVAFTSSGTKEEGSTTFVLVPAGTFTEITLDASLDGSGAAADDFDSGEDCLFVFQFVAGRTLAAMQIVTGTGAA